MNVKFKRPNRPEWEQATLAFGTKPTKDGKQVLSAVAIMPGGNILEVEADASQLDGFIEKLRELRRKL